ncbi:acyl-CoA dehydrogenase C-terminal domain-containing protein [Alphaproteobacteria bacterium]|nr:acyl-CoA dehydrogenase C-terminal domain-containing protein [Alphaproteobacteria bacterium]
MQIYKAPLKDINYLLNDFLNIKKYSNLSSFSGLNDELIQAILNEGSKFTEEVLLPLNASADKEGCSYNGGEVKTPEGFKGAYRKFIESGWSSITARTEYGGQGLPNVLGYALMEMIISTNMAFGTYPGLTQGASQAILKVGNKEQKDKFLPKLVSGEWSGTMNLTEPQCGTDLGLIKTKAIPNSNDSYKITGTKIFITAGEHDLSENIIHLVLARTPDSLPGIKGLSLFIVPKYNINKDGSLGSRNEVSCGSIENKMGLKASATCVMNYDSATGYLLGSENKGMSAMFIMMNEARLGVAMQGLGLSEVAYQNAAAYSKDRHQGKALNKNEQKEKVADPIIVHPDVRRMLLEMRSFNEGARALTLWTALNVDLSEDHPDQSTRQNSSDYLALITPIIKAFLTDSAFENTNLALQCYGGHGYIRDNGIEQFVRDARITQLYEGTSGIQALDLVGRKLPKGMGKLLRQFFHPVDSFIKSNMENKELSDLVLPLAKSFARLQQATAWVAQNGLENPNEAAGASSDYLKMFGFVAMAFMWARMAKISKEKLLDSNEEVDFHKNKLILADFYMKKILPQTSGLLSKITAGSGSLMAMKNKDF